MPKTKIVCTLGPSTDQEGILEQCVAQGMNVARFNFSHGDHAIQQKRVEQCRELQKKCKQPLAMLLDTKGPEIRLGNFVDGKVSLKQGQAFVLTTEDVMGDETISHVSYQDLPNDVEVGTRILINDGLVEMRVEEVRETSVVCRVGNDSILSNYKGVNIPGLHLNIPYLSEQDKSDLIFGINQDFDFVAASFVRTADDIRNLRNFLHENGGDGILIIAKIENREGVQNIDEIIDASDGIMIARGDMGVELPEEDVPVLQKLIISKVYQAGKQVITATQMLESMVNNPRPTRAEVADVANAIYDGTSAIMLSGETAAGKFPVDAVSTMVRIAENIENHIDYKKRFFHQGRQENPDITDAVCHATCTTAYDLGASAIVAVTKTGRAAKMISRYRPACPILGGTTSKKVWRQLALSWGVKPLLLEEKVDVLELFSHAVEQGKKEEMLEDGDLAIITSGVPLGQSGTTNMMKVVKV